MGTAAGGVVVVATEDVRVTPTVLIFLKAPVAGAVKTRLAARLGEARALQIYRWLAERQLAAIPAGWPVEVHHAPGDAAGAAAMRAWLGEASGRTYWAQPDGDLGGRLRAATVGAFARGAEAVLLIGGDCPALDDARLTDAARVLAGADVVMGPARDGGYYLLGMRTPQLGLLEGIDWSTPLVAAQTRARARSAELKLAELEELADVDTVEDWREWEEHLP